MACSSRPRRRRRLADEVGRHRHRRVAERHRDRDGLVLGERLARRGVLGDDVAGGRCRPGGRRACLTFQWFACACARACCSVRPTSVGTLWRRHVQLDPRERRTASRARARRRTTRSAIEPAPAPLARPAASRRRSRRRLAASAWLRLDVRPPTRRCASGRQLGRIPVDHRDVARGRGARRRAGSGRGPVESARDAASRRMASSPASGRSAGSGRPARSSDRPAAARAPRAPRRGVSTRAISVAMVVSAVNGTRPVTASISTRASE